MRNWRVAAAVIEYFEGGCVSRTQDARKSYAIQKSLGVNKLSNYFSKVSTNKFYK
jgi:hypothetical protein